MEFLLPLAAKSLLIAGITLVVLQLMKRRSAADRSWIAHLGLASIAIVPLAWLLLPQLEVATSWIGAEPAAEQAVAIPTVVEAEAAPSAATFPVASETAAAAPVDWAFWAYAAPAGLLVLLTLIALLRLVLLKSKANVLVEPHWLTALAHAQRRMGFKHGTALLTSDDLRSPISWGLMRPVILLNSEAAKAHGEAEAIIAHELAHVARLDWVKLLLSRVTVALFWFNPLVWMLAREAHQLREEAADDAVLASNIEDTDYARLLVGIARHECRGLLLGAHGVAPGRTSLARRVQRVLDAASQRTSGGWRWTAAAGFFAAGMAVPLAALHLVPTSPVAAANVASVGGKAARPAANAAGMSSASTAAAAPSSAIAAAAGTAVLAHPHEATITRDESGQTVLRSQGSETIVSSRNGQLVLRSSDGGTVTIYPADASGRSRTVIRGRDGSVASYADAGAIPGLASALAARPPRPPRPPRPLRSDDDPIERAIELKAVGATPEYVRSIRRAAPHLRLDHDDIVELKALGVSPAYLGELASVGYTRLDAGDVVEAKAVGVTGSYARSMAAAGYGRLSLERLMEMKALGITPADVAKYRRAGGRLPSFDQLAALKGMRIDPHDIDLDPDIDPDHDPDPDPDP